MADLYSFNSVSRSKIYFGICLKTEDVGGEPIPDNRPSASRRPTDSGASTSTKITTGMQQKRTRRPAEQLPENWKKKRVKNNKRVDAMVTTVGGNQNKNRRSLNEHVHTLTSSRTADDGGRRKKKEALR